MERSALTYAAPLVAGTALVALLARAARGAIPGAVGAALAAALAFIAGGASETYAGAQVAALAIALGATVFGGGVAARRARIPVVVGLAGALLATVLLCLAPGNTIREAAIGNHEHTIAGMTTTTIGVTAWIVTSLVANHLILALLVMVISAGVAGSSPRAQTASAVSRWGVITIVGLAVGACLASMAPSAWAAGGPPPGRAHIVPVAVVLGTCAVLGGAAGMAIARKAGAAPVAHRFGGSHALSTVLAAAVAALVVVGPGTSLARTVARYPTSPHMPAPRTSKSPSYRTRRYSTVTW